MITIIIITIIMIIIIIDVAIPDVGRVGEKEDETVEKYQDLARALSKNVGCKEKGEFGCNLGH